MNKLTEGRKSNILKTLSQLHAYLSRYDDLDKAEEHFKQRFEDAGCSDMYAVIDEVLDVVDTAKKSEKAKLLAKIYKQYFPKSSKEDPATEEEVEAAMDEHHLDGVGKDSEESEEPEGEETEEEVEEDDGKTLGDVRKPDTEYMAAAAAETEDEEDEEIEESIQKAKFRAAKIREGLDPTDDDFVQEIDEEDFTPFDKEALGYSSEEDEFEPGEEEDYIDDDVIGEDSNLDDFDDDMPEIIEDENEESTEDFPVPEQALVGTQHDEGADDSLTSASHRFIDDLIDSGAADTDEEIIDALVKEFSDPEYSSMEHRMDRGMARDILEEYQANRSSENDEATEGDILDAYEDMAAEGYPRNEALETLSQRFGLSQHEIKMIIDEEGEMPDHDLDTYYRENDEYPIGDQDPRDPPTEESVSQELEEARKKGEWHTVIDGDRVSRRAAQRLGDLYDQLDSSKNKKEVQAQINKLEAPYGSKEWYVGPEHCEAGDVLEMTHGEPLKFVKGKNDHRFIGKDSTGKNVEASYNDIIENKGRELEEAVRDLPAEDENGRPFDPDRIPVTLDIQTSGNNVNVILTSTNGQKRICSLEELADIMYQDDFEAWMDLDSDDIRIHGPYNVPQTAWNALPRYGAFGEAVSVSAPVLKQAIDYITFASTAHFTPTTISTTLSSKFGLSPEQIQYAYRYANFMKRRLESKINEGTMAGPSDMGGSNIPPPHTGPSASPAPASNTSSTDIPIDANVETADVASNVDPNVPDPQELLQQNPDLANLFAAMSKVDPKDIQNMSASLGIKEAVDPEDSLSTFEKPAPRSSRAAHPEAMDVVKDICEKLGYNPKFINPGARGYQVRLGVPSEISKMPILKVRSMSPEARKLFFNKPAVDLQKKLNKIGYSDTKAIMVGSCKDWLAFVVPYDAKLFE